MSWVLHYKMISYNYRKICDSYRKSIVPFWNLWVIVDLKLADSAYR